MDNIKEALAYIASLGVQAERAEILKIDGKMHTTKALARCDKAEKARPISATTLTSLVDYIKNSRDELRDRMIIQIMDETRVVLYSGLLQERDRETLFESRTMLPEYYYNRGYKQEEFLIALQACFLPTEDREAVALMASNVTNTQEQAYSDDGVTQQATMRTGITTKENVIVPNPVRLMPYRTFLEVGQPESDFVFRIGGKEAQEFKLIEADGGKWKSEAMQNIKDYLTNELKDIPNREQITIIA